MKKYKPNDFYFSSPIVIEEDDKGKLMGAGK